MDHNANFFNQHCLSLTRFAVILFIGVMFACSDDNEAPLDPPAVPTGFSVLSVFDDRVMLVWDEMEDVTHYGLFQNDLELDRNILDPHYTATNLDAITLYLFSLQACNEGGCSPQTNLILDTAPVTPDSLVAEEVTSTTILLSWLASRGATHYVIDTGSIQITNDGADFYEVTNLQASTSYFFTVKACNGYGCSPETSVDVTTPPAVPTGFSAISISNDRVVLTWDEREGVTHYGLFQNDLALDRNISDTHYIATNLDANTPYFFSLQACNEGGCSPQTKLILTTALDAPKNFTARKVTSAAVTLEWDAVTGAREYIIYRENIPVVTNTALTHTVVNLRFSTSYNFFVRACNSQSCSDLVLKQVTTLEAPDSFSIAYPDMDSTTPDISSPVFISSESCNILDYTFAGKARYSIDRNTIGSDEPVLPTIDPTAGVVSNNGFASPGVYRVTVTIPENVDCNTDVLVYNAITPADRSELGAAVNSGIGFHGNTGNFNYIITSQITDMSQLFQNEYNFNGDITEWDTSKVTNMSSMFGTYWYNFSVFNQPIGGWDTSQVRDMRAMFAEADSFNQPLSNWNTSKVEDMNSMFHVASAFNQPLSNWNTSQVNDMGWMFKDAKAFNQDLSGWVVPNVRNHWEVFNGSAMAGKAEQHPKWP